MLGKLFKYEWKSISKIGCIMLLTLLAVTLLGSVALWVSPLGKIMEGDSTVLNNEMQSFVFVISMVASLFLYILLLMGVMYGIVIYLGVHFYKTMYTDQGYLTHTLPVSSHQLLISKTLAAGLWNLLIFLALGISVIVLTAVLAATAVRATDAGLNFGAFWEEFGDMLAELVNEMDMRSLHYIIVLMLTLLLSPFSSAMMMFGALTIGQLSRKHKVLMGIVAYVGLMMVNYILSLIGQLCTATFYSNSYSAYGNYMLLQYDLSLLQSVVFGVVLYFVSHYIISRKLNLE